MKRFVCFLLTFLMIVSLVPATVLTASAASSLKTSDKAVELIKQFEGFSQKSYTHGGKKYIGYGTYIEDDAKYVSGITQAEATTLLKNYLYDVVDVKINNFAKKYNLAFTQNQHDALASLSYNTGYTWMNSDDSVCQAIVNGKRGNELLDAFASWTGTSPEYEFFNGLINRRLAEANLFLNNIYNSTAPSNFSYVILDSKGADVGSVNKQFAFNTSTSPKLSVKPTKSGDTFLGWYLVDAEKGTETPVTVLDKTYAKKTLTAKWQNGTTEVATKYTINSSASASRDVFYNTDSMAAANKKGTLKANSSFAVTLEKLVGDIKWIYGKGDNTDGKTIEGWVPYVNVKEENLSSDNVISTGTVTATTLPVYEAATTSDPDKTNGVAVPFGTLKKGDVLKIYAYKSEYTASGTKSWGKVAYNGGYGWVNLAYVDLRNATTEDNTSLVGKTGKIVNADQVNVRDNPGTSGTTVKYTIAKDTKVTIYETRQVINGTSATNWGRIKWNNNLNEGWIYLYYVQVDGQTNSGTAAPDVALYTGVVNSNINLNVRTGPSVGSTHVGSLPRGTKVNVYEKKTTNGVEWGRIDNDRWVCLLYVSLTATGNNPNGSNDPVHVLEKEVGTVTASALILRKGASNNSELLDTLIKGTEVVIEETVEETSGGITKKWGKVTVNGKTGYINLAYVEINKITVSIPETPVNPETGVYGRVVNCMNLNVRAAAGVRNTLVTTIPVNTMVTVYEQTEVDGATWGRVKDGWVSMGYIEITGNTGNNGSGNTGNSGSNPGAATITGTVNSNIDLNVRNGAGLGAAKIGALKKGTKVTVTEQKVADGMSWGKIKYSGNDGWVCMSYITIDSTTSSGNGTSVMGTIARCFSAVNVRSAAGVGNALIGTIPVGTRVEVFEKTMVNGEYWARVANGWICMQYVILDEELPDATEPTQPSTEATKPVDSDKENPNVAVVYSFDAKVKAGTVIFTEAAVASNAAGEFSVATDVTIESLKLSADGKRTLWGHVSTHGVPGWIQFENITSFTITGYVHTDGLKVYAAADTGSENIGSLKVNDSVTVEELALFGSTVFGKVTAISGGAESYKGWIDLSKIGKEKLVLTPEVNATNGTAIINAKTTEKTPAYTSVKAESVAYNVVKNTTVNVQELIADHGILWGKISADVKGESVTAYIELNKLIYVCAVTCNANADAKAYSNYGAGEADTPVNIDADNNHVAIGDALTFTSFAVDASGHVWGQIKGTTYNGAWIDLANTNWT